MENKYAQNKAKYKFVFYLVFMLVITSSAVIASFSLSTLLRVAFCARGFVFNKAPVCSYVPYFTPPLHVSTRLPANLAGRVVAPIDRAGCVCLRTTVVLWSCKWLLPSPTRRLRNVAGRAERPGDCLGSHSPTGNPSALGPSVRWCISFVLALGIQYRTNNPRIQESLTLRYPIQKQSYMGLCLYGVCPTGSTPQITRNSNHIIKQRNVRRRGRILIQERPPDNLFRGRN